MINLDQKEQKIIKIFLKNKELQSSDVHKALTDSGEDTSLVTTKRTLSDLTDKNILEMKGAGRSSRYTLTVKGRVFADVEPKEYISVEPDKRYGLDSFNFGLFQNFPKEIFSEDEVKELQSLTDKYNEKSKDITDTIHKKELERLTIELSWKSSKIEGNTYTLLDTEKLIKEGKPAKGKTQQETQMILNHKDAFYFIYQNKDNFKSINKENLIKVHKLLVKDLNINTGFRESLVGIAGSKYQPLDNIYQIEESLEALFKLVSKIKDPFSKALVALVGISYIQPFEDGNKRTSRLITNALLLAHDCAPLSYRSVDEEEYKSAALVFYELSSIVPFKKIFTEQYKFAVKKYNIG